MNRDYIREYLVYGKRLIDYVRDDVAGGGGGGKPVSNARGMYCIHDYRYVDRCRTRYPITSARVPPENRYRTS